MPKTLCEIFVLGTALALRQWLMAEAERQQREQLAESTREEILQERAEKERMRALLRK